MTYKLLSANCNCNKGDLVLATCISRAFTVLVCRFHWPQCRHNGNCSLSHSAHPRSLECGQNHFLIVIVTLFSRNGVINKCSSRRISEFYSSQIHLQFIFLAKLILNKVSLNVFIFICHRSRGTSNLYIRSTTYKALQMLNCTYTQYSVTANIIYRLL